METKPAKRLYRLLFKSPGVKVQGMKHFVAPFFFTTAEDCDKWKQTDEAKQFIADFFQSIPPAWIRFLIRRKMPWPLYWKTDSCELDPNQTHSEAANLWNAVHGANFHLRVFPKVQIVNLEERKQNEGLQELGKGN